ncbi:nicotinate phosphoribosyltransferase [Paenibacillus alvei]|uniref:nicotinate phosphoribosyltransferase n=1 Tax=Paenibacillus alvei TaxID=44250 RepID=UPI0022808F0E|nr:nicotinate phosphoribosyltransferase [Paenibacillus alvei]MCY9737481.1 nicotinate phosphoribosyltransferase [Paenibacillus alvei]
MKKYTYNPMLLCDFYKISHREQYPQGTEYVFSTWTPRSSRIDGINKVVAFGFQAFIKKYLIDYFNENFFNRPKKDVVNEYKRIIKHTLNIKNPDTEHIEKLHDLGYLPIMISAVPEGTLVPIRVPMLTIENTEPEFFWLTNFLETLMSCELWQASTDATIALQYRKILNSYAKLTTGSTAGVEFQGHDFSMRGMAGLEAAKSAGAGHLLSFSGSDSIPAALFLEEFYNANVEEELVITSIPATEHSVMCANGRDEKEVIERLITEVYPSGFASIVCDTWDFWNVVDTYVRELKDVIMNRDGKVVIRPDSGNPVDILCGKVFDQFESVEEATQILEDNDVWDEATEACAGRHCMGDSEYVKEFKVGDKYYRATYEVEYNRHDKTYYYVDGIDLRSCEEFIPTPEDKGLIELLWEIFGGTVTPQGYKVLDSHIGAIYGDSITLERCEAICKRLKDKGFASTNVVFGVGSYTYQYNTRDTFGFALKATHVKINGEEKQIFKDPKTDSGMKKSQMGMVVVYKDDDGNITYKDGLSIEETVTCGLDEIMQNIFLNGHLRNEQSLKEIRERLNNQ